MHASLVVFRPYPETVAVVPRGWEVIGTPGPLGTRRVQLTGSPPLDLLLRVREVPTAVRSRAAKWRVTLCTPDQSPTCLTPALDAEVTLEALAGGRSILRLSGSVTRDFARQTSGSINGYARSLLDQLDQTVMPAVASVGGSGALLRR